MTETFAVAIYIYWPPALLFKEKENTMQIAELSGYLAMLPVKQTLLFERQTRLQAF